MKKSLVIAAAVATTASTAAFAQTSSPAEFRGYENCVDAAEAESNGLTTPRSYLLNTAGDNTSYYINASRWAAGEREQVRITCETTKNGRVLLSSAVEPGRWVQDSRTRVRVELASK